MWGSFAFALGIAVFILFVPGWLFCRGLRFNGAMATACAPVVAVAAVSVLPVFYGKLGVACTAATVLVPFVVVSAVLFLAAVARRKADVPTLVLPGVQTFRFRGRERSFDAWTTWAYIAVATIVCFTLFVSSLESATAFFCRWDNQTHLNLVRNFLDSGIWSSLITSVYNGVSANQNPYLSQPAFYPSAWHDMAALVASLAGAPVTIAVNALNVALVCAVMPVGLFAFMKSLFPNDRLTVGVGAFMGMAFAGLPWSFFVKGPLYPNLLGLVLLPAVVAAFMAFVGGGLVRRKPVAFALLALASFASLALAHPNSLFALFVVLAAYMAHVIGAAFDKRAADAQGAEGQGAERQGKPAGSVRVRKFAAVGAFALACVAFWLLCYKLPFLQGIVQYNSAGDRSVLTALAAFGTISFPHTHPEPFVMVACIVGLVHFLRSRRLWVLFPPVFMAIVFVVTLTVSAPIQHMLGGFWYCDYYRIGTFLALFMVPVASAGLAAVMRFFATRFKTRGEEKARKADSSATQEAVSARGKSYARCAAIVVFALFVAGTALPSVYVPVLDKSVDLGFSYMHKKFHNMYTSDWEQIYDFDERAFVDRAVDVVGEDALVINAPNDGSVFAYAVNGMDTYFRSCRAGGQTETAQTIRNGLCNYATDAQVQQAVRSTGAKYVLLLDQGVAYSEGKWLMQYKNPEAWEGINLVKDDTPGFKVVLAEGDMRLYEIQDLSAEPAGSADPAA